GATLTSHRRNSGTEFPTKSLFDVGLDPRNLQLEIYTMSRIRVLAGTRKDGREGGEEALRFSPSQRTSASQSRTLLRHIYPGRCTDSSSSSCCWLARCGRQRRRLREVATMKLSERC